MLVAATYGFARSSGSAANLSVSERVRRPSWPRSRGRSALLSAIDSVVHRDEQSRERGREIARKQTTLRRAVSPTAWRRYLDLEEVQLQRSARWLEVVARWAHREGKRRRR